MDPYYTDNLYRVSDLVVVAAQPSAGYTFLEWSGDVSGIADVSRDNVSFVMTDNRTITANFVESWVRYTVTVAAEPAAGGSVEVSPAQDNYTPNQVVSVTAAGAPGYVFDHWTGGLSGTVSPADLRLNANKAVAAVFHPVLSVQVEAPGAGTVEANPPITAAGYEAGTAVSLTARPSPGYAFDKWSGQTAGITDAGQAAVTVVVNGPLALTATFAALPRFSLAASVQDQDTGSLTLEPVQPAEGYLANQRVRVYAVAAEGYVFSHWTGEAVASIEAVASVEAVASGAVLELDMTRARTLVAVFHPRVTVACDPADGGEVDMTAPQPSGGYLAGSEVTLEAVALDGYRFERWEGDASGTENPAVIRVDSPKSVTAVFAGESAMAWWWIPVVAAVALAVLVGLPLELAVRRRVGSRSG